MNIIKRIAYNQIIPVLGRLMVKKNHYCNVIYYHDIVDNDGYSYMRTNVDLFKQQMQYLAENKYETMRFDDFSEMDNITFRKNRVLIAFDDGWLSNYTMIFDFMKSIGLKYNVFLAVGLIGEDARYLTWDRVREMHQSGLCGFGTHTFSHVDLSRLDDGLFDAEVRKADDRFEKELGFAPMDFCYPFGKYSTDSNQKLMSDSNYERIYLSSMSYSYKQADRFIMGRNGISNDDSMSIFKNKVNGFYNAFSVIAK